MSIASEITRLSGVRSDIFTSITNKGVTVPATATFSSCPALIDSITGGGGGSPTSLINPSFTASGYLSAYRPFTATQNVVPLYDTVTGNYTTGVIDGSQYYIEIPMEVLTGGITGYSLNFGLYTWSISQSNRMMIVPNVNDFYASNYTTDVMGSDFVQSASQTPPLYVCTINNDNFDYWWSQIQQQSWILPAYTGSTFVLTYQNFTQATAIGNYTQLTQTGIDVPYPTYSTTTTGFITNEISGNESFTGSTNKVPYIYVSGFKNVVYDDSPEGGTQSLTPVGTNITSFSSNMLKNKITTKTNYNLNSTAYTYNYGSVVSGYSGFEGV